MPKPTEICLAEGSDSVGWPYFIIGFGHSEEDKIRMAADAGMTHDEWRAAGSRRDRGPIHLHARRDTVKHYAVVTFGWPTNHIGYYYLNEQRARDVADEAKGTGSCTNARVHECESRKLAISADISQIREGEA